MDLGQGVEGGWGAVAAAKALHDDLGRAHAREAKEVYCMFERKVTAKLTSLLLF